MILRRARFGRLHIAALAAGVAAFAVVVAGCGGSSTSPSVANLGTTSPSATGGESSSPGLPPPGAFPVGSSMSTEVGTGSAGVSYAACMRSHGLPSFPDPNSQGVITITVSTSLDPSSPLFGRARGACQHLLPAGTAPSPARQQLLKEHALAFAACMRSHGVPHYPDPVFGSGGTISQSLCRGEADPKSPLFQAAQKACQKPVVPAGAAG